VTYPPQAGDDLPHHQSDPGWIVQNGRFVLTSANTETSRPLLELLWGLPVIHPSVEVAWQALLQFWTIPMQEGDDGVSFQVHVVREEEPSVEVLLFREVRQSDDGSWLPWGVGYQFLFPGVPPGLTECELWSRDYSGPGAFVSAVEQSPQYQMLANASSENAAVVVDQLE
jgi:hypothetical protein